MGFGYNGVMNIPLLKEQLALTFKNENTGHGFDHLERVFRLAKTLAEDRAVNDDILTLIAFLHDVDDYKFTSIASSQQLPNATRWMIAVDVPQDIQDLVKSEIRCLGFNKALEGIRPKTREGQLVSDADMCDALGAQGILRVYAYAASKRQPFFLPNVFPNLAMTAEAYRQQGSSHTINHFFEKLLRLPSMMLTEQGKREAEKRQEVMVQFLMHFFEEENVPRWREYLNSFLNK